MRTLYLLRHAEAFERLDWRADDHLRPLTLRGLKQARRMAKRLAGAGLKLIETSPSLRCIQTAAPLAERCGLRLVVNDRLLEGRRLSVPSSEADVLLCGHGDGIPWLLQDLGVSFKKCEKGSCWRLVLAGREVLEAAYLPPEA